MANMASILGKAPISRAQTRQRKAEACTGM
jgi:hypothetical protein